MIHIEASKETIRKGTIIVLHGWAQNAKIMHHKTLTLTRKLKNVGYDVIFLEAKIILPMVSTILVDGNIIEKNHGKRENAKAWFIYDKDDICNSNLALSTTKRNIHYIGIDDSISIVQNYLTTLPENEFVALYGFSQGGTFVHILASLVATSTSTTTCTTTNVCNEDDDEDDEKEQQATTAKSSSTKKDPWHKIKCVICAGAFPARHVPEPNSQYKEINMLNNSNNNKNKICIPSLHVIGKNDTSVPPNLSHDLATLFFDQPNIYYHDKGHLVSQNSATCTTIIDFLQKQQQKRYSSSSSSKSK